MARAEIFSFREVALLSAARETDPVSERDQFRMPLTVVSCLARRPESLHDCDGVTISSQEVSLDCRFFTRLGWRRAQLTSQCTQFMFHTGAVSISMLAQMWRRAAVPGMLRQTTRCQRLLREAFFDG